MSYSASSRQLRFLALLSMLFCLGEAAIAQDIPARPYLTQQDAQTDPKAISETELVWAAFHVITNLESNSPGTSVTFLQTIGLSQADAIALSKHARFSESDLKTEVAEQWKTFCSSGTALGSSRDLLARSYQSMDTAADDRMALDIKELDEVISVGAKQVLVSWATQNLRPNMAVTRIDHAQRLAVDNVNVQNEVGELCSEKRPRIGIQKPVITPDGGVIVPSSR